MVEQDAETASQSPLRVTGAAPVTKTTPSTWSMLHCCGCDTITKDPPVSEPASETTKVLATPIAAYPPIAMTKPDAEEEPPPIAAQAAEASLDTETVGQSEATAAATEPVAPAQTQVAVEVTAAGTETVASAAEPVASLQVEAVVKAETVEAAVENEGATAATETVVSAQVEAAVENEGATAATE